MERKVNAMLNNEKGTVNKKQAAQAPLNQREADDLKVTKKTTMTGLASGKVAKGMSAQERLGAGNRRATTVTQYLKSLDTQLLMMKKTDENLINRLKESKKEQDDVDKRHKLNLEY